MDKEQLQVIMPKVKKVAIFAGILIALVICYNILLGYNSATQLLVKQSPNGSMSCIDHAGFYFKGPFTTIYSYDRTKDFYFNSSTEKVKGEGWEGGDDDEDDVSVTLSRNANADISGYLKYQIPTDCEDLIKIHREQRSDKKLKHDLVRNAVLSAVRKTAPLFTAEEAKVTKIAEFRRLAEDQLIDGEYLTMIQTLQEKAGEDEMDANGNVIKKAEVQEYKVTQLKLDESGNRILTKPSALKQYGIKVLQFEIQNVKLDEKAQKQLDIVKEREMQRVANATAAETAKQAAVTAKAEGDAKIAAAKAEQEVVKIAEVTKAQKEKEVAILQAQKEQEVARLEALKALEVAKKIKAEKEAEAAANRALVNAGLTPQEKANINKEIAIGIAAQLAESKGQWTPYIINGHDAKTGPGTQFGMALEIDMIRNIKELADNLNK